MAGIVLPCVRQDHRGAVTRLIRALAHQRSTGFLLIGEKAVALLLPGGSVARLCLPIALGGRSFVGLDSGFD